MFSRAKHTFLFNAVSDKTFYYIYIILVQVFVYGGIPLLISNDITCAFVHCCVTIVSLVTFADCVNIQSRTTLNSFPYTFYIMSLLYLPRFPFVLIFFLLSSSSIPL